MPDVVTRNGYTRNTTFNAVFFVVCYQSSSYLPGKVLYTLHVGYAVSQGARGTYNTYQIIIFQSRTMKRYKPVHNMLT